LSLCVHIGSIIVNIRIQIVTKSATELIEMD